jgi:methylmalonyl-CoA mutase N-terminal domain/subunit
MTTVRELEDVVRQQQEELDALRAQVARWQSQFSTGRKRDIAFTNSANEVPPLYTALDLADTAGTAFEVPGDYPFTRGIHPTGYRGKLWTMRQFAGFGTARETNQRYKFLLSQGQTGLSVAFDFPTLMGYDSDHVRSEGEVGKCGVSIMSPSTVRKSTSGIG